MSKKLTRLNLHDRLKKHAFEHAFLTTYNFGTQFFEEYALEHFKSLQDNGNVTVLLDDREYQELLQSATEAPESFPKQANLRYLLHPIRVAGVFHPKVFLFVGKRRGLLVVGSANFTQEGIGSNAEMVATFDYEREKSEAALPLFQEALRFFELLAERWPSEQLQSNLQAMVAEADWLSAESTGAERGELPKLLHNLESPLWDQLTSRLHGPVSHVAVLSRYFESQPSLAEFALAETQAQLLTLYTQNGITTLTDKWLESSAFKKNQLEINLCSYADEEHFQHLHGKAIAFTCGKQITLAMGSANFTSAALRRIAKSGNLEVMLCYPPIPGSQFSPVAWFDPDGTGVALRRPDQLQTAAEEVAHGDHPSIKDGAMVVHEALVEGDYLKVVLASGTPVAGMHCRVAQSDRSALYLRNMRSQEDALYFKLAESDLKRLRAAPGVAQLGVHSGAHEWQAQSNPVLITNLQDVHTGGDLRSARQIREARESPQRFMNVLNLLCSGEDDERLKQFLTYCDIPMDLPVRLLRKRSPDSQSTKCMTETLRILGDRNLKHFELLHDAVMDFAKRHRRRLERHVDSGIASGVSNYLHILLTLANLLLSQISRLVVTLETGATVEMSSARWHHIRGCLDAYYQELRSLFSLTSMDYLDSVADCRNAARYDQEFVESVPELIALLEQAVRQRDDLFNSQQTNLVVVAEHRRISAPGFFKSILAQQNWSPFAEELQGYGDKLTGRFVA